MKTETERVQLTPEQLDAMMPEGEYVHTFVQAGQMLLGADWKRAEILAAAREHGAELSGEQATAMKHGAVILEPKRGAVFIATNPTPSQPEGEELWAN